jgi:hypothetical protein
MRMQQASHQTLSLALLLSTFTVFMVPHSLTGAGRLGRLGWLLLKARNSCGGVVRLMLAAIDSAGKHKFSCRNRLSLAVIAIQRKQDGQMALAATNAEIPSLIGFGPGKIHGVGAFFVCVWASEALSDFRVLRSSRMRVLLCILAFRWRSKRERLPFLWDITSPSDLAWQGFILGSFRPPRGRQSRNESEKPNTSKVVFKLDNSNE